MIGKYTVYALARMAECGAPDSFTSPGADWLSTFPAVAREILSDSPEATNDGALSDAVHEQADSIVPVYTAHKWRVFTDLAAWQEDVTEYGPIEDYGAGGRCRTRHDRRKAPVHTTPGPLRVNRGYGRRKR